MHVGVFSISCFETHSSTTGVVLFLLPLVKGVLNFEQEHEPTGYFNNFCAFICVTTGAIYISNLACYVLEASLGRNRIRFHC